MIAGQAQKLFNEIYILSLLPQCMTWLYPLKLLNLIFNLLICLECSLTNTQVDIFAKEKIIQLLRGWINGTVITGESRRKGLVSSILPCANGSGIKGWQESHHIECGSSELYWDYGKPSRKIMHRNDTLILTEDLSVWQANFERAKMTGVGGPVRWRLQLLRS